MAKTVTTPSRMAPRGFRFPSTAKLERLEEDHGPGRGWFNYPGSRGIEVISAAATFYRVFGSNPEGVWAAPGRVNLIGEHTDYNDGLCLPFALAERTEAAIAPRSDGHIRICSAQNPGEVIEIKAANLTPGLPSGWAAYVAGVPWAFELAKGFNVAVDSSVPVGSGLSSSAALMCAVGLGLNEMLGLGFTRDGVARRTRRTEKTTSVPPPGVWTRSLPCSCTAGHALLYDVAADTTEQIPFDPGSAGLVVLAVDSMVRHGHADGAYRERRGDCEESARILGVETLREVERCRPSDRRYQQLGHERLAKRTRHIVTENQRVLDTATALQQGSVDQGRRAPHRGAHFVPRRF